MIQRKKPPPPPSRRVVWRISEAAPLGEFVDLDAIAAPLPPAAPLPEAATYSGGWVVSSFELLNGTDVNDGPETVPDDLFDELFAPPTPPAAPKKPSDD